MAKLPHTSETAIAITFLVMNLSALLRQVFCLFLCIFHNQVFFGVNLLLNLIIDRIVDNKRSLLLSSYITT